MPSLKTPKKKILNHYYIVKTGITEHELPPTQQTLFETLEQKLFKDIYSYLKKYNSKGPRIKAISKEFKLDKKQAEKIYERAMSMLYFYEHHIEYLQNKEYYEWLWNNPNASKILKRKSKYRTRKRLRNDRNHFRRLSKGMDHVVEINTKTANPEELESELDNPRLVSLQCWGPITELLKLLLITEKDARKLYEKGLMVLTHGQEGTLFDHNFHSLEHIKAKKAEFWKGEKPAKCDCGSILSPNVLGFNAKIGYPKDKAKCLECIGVSEEYFNEVIGMYKSEGCTMFS